MGASSRIIVPNFCFMFHFIYIIAIVDAASAITQPCAIMCHGAMLYDAIRPFVMSFPFLQEVMEHRCCSFATRHDVVFLQTCTDYPPSTVFPLTPSFIITSTSKRKRDREREKVSNREIVSICYLRYDFVFLYLCFCSARP